MLKRFDRHEYELPDKKRDDGHCREKKIPAVGDRAEREQLLRDLQHRSAHALHEIENVAALKNFWPYDAASNDEQSEERQRNTKQREGDDVAEDPSRPVGILPN